LRLEGQPWPELRSPITGTPFKAEVRGSLLRPLECEVLYRNRFPSHPEDWMAIFYITEGVFSPAKRHSALCCLSPIEYERTPHELT